jgi:uncharacterized repeat protein (TIGR03803 family)
MNRKRFLGAASAALMIVIVTTLVLASGASAQSKYKTLYKFKGGTGGSQPWAGLILDANGNLYGTTLAGGSHKAGTVFKLTPTATGWSQTVLYSFTGGADGGMNASGAGLVFDGAGNLYGTAGSGGVYGAGVVFELTPTSSGWAESVLYSFSGAADGGYPYAGLIFDSAGSLYGTTWGGGRVDCGNGCGVVFKLAPTSSGWIESVLYAFGPNGQNSDAELVFDGASNLYGVTWYAGAYGWGVVFKLSPNSDGSWTESVLYQFKGYKDGAHPRAGLIFDSLGNLYSTTANEYASGYGIVFKLVSNSDGSWTKHTLHQFTGGKDGANPYVGVTFDTGGNLYGTTNGGGAFGYGVAFKLTPTSTGGWTYRVLHAFKDAPGANPRGNLVGDKAGNLYGTTFGDGRKTHGSVFEITP